MASRPDETRAGVDLTNLDQPLFDGAAASKRELVDYLDGVSELLLPDLRDRPLSVIRVTRGQGPFMQKNLPKHAPDWVERVGVWAEASRRTVHYAVCNDRRALLWFANQRAVEYHPGLLRVTDAERTDRLVIDIDPPEGAGFGAVVGAARLVEAALRELGLAAAVKTSGAKGVHVVVPIEPTPAFDDAAAATRAIAARAERLDPGTVTTAFLKADRGGKVFLDATRAGGATLVAAYSPRVRPGVPVSFPLAWDELDSFTPGEVTIRNALDRLAGRPAWSALLPPAQVVPGELVAEGREIPVPRVAAMHEGRRRRATTGPAPRARRDG